jgi:hypothetical protein
MILPKPVNYIKMNEDIFTSENNRPSLMLTNQIFGIAKRNVKNNEHTIPE